MLSYAVSDSFTRNLLLSSYRPPSTPWVLLHGWGFGPAIWEPIRYALPPDFPLLTPELPGYGELYPEVIPDQSTLVDQLRTRLPQSFHLGGWSYGGQIALLLAHRHPQAVRSLTLIGSSPCFGARRDWQDAISPLVLEQFLSQTALEPALAHARFITLQAQHSPLTRSQAQWVRQFASAVPGISPQALATGLAQISNSDLRPLMRTIRTPSLIVHGQNDPIVPPSHAQWMHDQLTFMRGSGPGTLEHERDWHNGNPCTGSKSRLALIAGTGHLPFLTHQSQFLELACSFLADVDSTIRN